MAPVIDVNDGAFNRRADECAIDRDIGCLPWRAQEDVPQAEQGRGQYHREIKKARKPAAGEESVQVGVVRVLNERLVELKRADAERPVERKLRTQDVAAEPAERANIVGLLEGCALLEQLGHALG